MASGVRRGRTDLADDAAQDAFVSNCSRPLSRAHPSSLWFYSNGSDVSDWLAFGIAMDGVTAVSFEPNGRDVTLPVKGNVWTHRGR